MQVISLIDGTPQSQIPPESTNVYCDGTNYYCYFDGEEIPPEHIPTYGEPVPEADWLTFRLGMLQNTAYRTVAAAARDMERSHFEAEIRSPDPFLPILPVLWGQLLASAPEELWPTASDYQEWSALAESCHVGFSWSDEGVIQL